MGKRLNAGEYESVLRIATYLCRKRKNDVSFHHWRALGLIGLERYQEALDVVNGLESLRGKGGLSISDSWLIAFEEAKCRALYGLNQYDALRDYSSLCLSRHPVVIVLALAAYRLLATIRLGELTAATPCVRGLDGSIDNFHEPWHFFVLYSAHRHLGNEARAREVARLALAKYPDEAGVQEMVNGECAKPDSISPRIPSCHFRHFHHPK
jgi:hypothetical protein